LEIDPETGRLGAMHRNAKGSPPATV